MTTKVWTITGSSSGFGRALAEAVLAHGDRLVATARRPEQLQDLVERYPETAIAVELDVTNPEQIRSALQKARTVFGQIYEPTVGQFLNFLNTIEGQQPGDPIKAAQAIVQMVESENPPLRLVLGGYAYRKFRQKIDALTQELNEWESIGLATDFEA